MFGKIAVILAACAAASLGFERDYFDNYGEMEQIFVEDTRDVEALDLAYIGEQPQFAEPLEYPQPKYPQQPQQPPMTEAELAAQITQTPRQKHFMIGVYGAYDRASADVKQSVQGFEQQKYSFNERQLGTGVRAGYLLNDDHRLLASIEHHFKKNGFVYQDATIGYAFTPRLAGDLRLLLGADVGLSFARINAGNIVINGAPASALNYSGYTYGVRAGLLWRLGMGELEVGISARRLNFGSSSGSVVLGEAPTPLSIDLSSTSAIGAYMGYNFLF